MLKSFLAKNFKHPKIIQFCLSNEMKRYIIGNIQAKRPDFATVNDIKLYLKDLRTKNEEEKLIL